MGEKGDVVQKSFTPAVLKKMREKQGKQVGYFKNPYSTTEPDIILKFKCVGSWLEREHPRVISSKIGSIYLIIYNDNLECKK